MHERIEAFLRDVLCYQGKNSGAVREGVQRLLTAEREILAALTPAVPNGRTKRRTDRAVSKQVNARTI